eukprot:7390970-Prymnesium_polylepis.1
MAVPTEAEAAPEERAGQAETVVMWGALEAGDYSTRNIVHIRCYDQAPRHNGGGGGWVGGGGGGGVLGGGEGGGKEGGLMPLPSALTRVTITTTTTVATAAEPATPRAIALG